MSQERQRPEPGMEERKPPLPADQQDAPEPERPVPEYERRAGEGQPDKPSQAEGERETGEG
jgi:hypothetical protein